MVYLGTYDPEEYRTLGTLAVGNIGPWEHRTTCFYILDTHNSKCNIHNL